MNMQDMLWNIDILSKSNVLSKYMQDSLKASYTILLPLRQNLDVDWKSDSRELQSKVDNIGMNNY